jgi:hypothetical protein
MTMWLTEDEAKGKRCLNNQNERCIGSGCMAWRFATFFKDTKTGAAPMNPGAYDIGTAAECGYCGLAGKPDVNTGHD